MPFDRTQPYNDLPFLPPAPGLYTDPEILQKLVVASRALATVNGHIRQLPNPDLLINTLALQEAKTSTAIENIFTTEDKLYKAISDTARGEQADPATKEVLRYREALWGGYQRLREHNEITLDLILTIVKQVKNTELPIRPAHAQVVIRRGQSDLRPGEIVYTPPRHDRLLPELLNNVIDYMRNDEEYPGDPLLKMCIMHYQFEAIHPFQDGNGRTGRVLNLLYLVKKGLLNQPVLYLSKYIITHKEDYYYLLGAVTQRGNWKEWILYLLDAVEQTAVLTQHVIEEILGQMEATLEQGKRNIKWYNKEVNEALFTQPYLKPRVVGEMMGKSSRTTLTKYMDELVKASIVSPKKEGKEVYYLNNNLIRILESY